MVQTMMVTINTLTMPFWVAQAPVAPVVVPEAVPVPLFVPRFFIALISGLLLAFAIQLLFTNFSVAAGISFLGRSSHSDSEHSDDSGGGISVRKIGFGLGIWTLISVSIALFVACFLAIHLSLLNDLGLGAIMGLVIWAAYFTFLFWFSSNKVSSLIGSVIQVATSGFQAILGTATAAIGSKTAKKQMVSTAEAITSAVRHELGSGIDPESIRDSVEDYIQRIHLPELDLSKLRRDFETVLNDPEVEALAESDRLGSIDRQTFVDLVSRRTDLSEREVNVIADVLEGVWRRTLGRRRQRSDNMAELIDYLQSTKPGQIQVSEINAKLDRLLAERQRQQSASSNGPDAESGSQSSWWQQSLQMGLNSLIGMVVGRTDLSDLDVQTLIEKLKGASNQVNQQGGKVVKQLQGEEDYPSPIRTDVENYLLNTYSWQMNQSTIGRDFRDVLYDPSADPGAVADELSRLNRTDFVELLSSRGVFTQSKIQAIADQLESIRKEVLSVARAAQEREIALELRQRVEIYLSQTPREQLLYSENGILPAFQALLEDSDADHETLILRLAPYDRETLRQLIAPRQEITPDEAERILDALEATRRQVLAESKTLDEKRQGQMMTMQQRLESYLRDTGRSELNPDGIKRDLQLLFNDPQTGLSALRHRASQFDRDTLTQLLRQREDVNEADVNHILDQVESTWHKTVHSPRNAAGAAKDRYDQTTSAIADYLRQTNLEELDPDGIQRDLRTLLSDPKEGTQALRQRLSRVDRETLIRLLSQRNDLSEAQANRIIDQVLTAISQITRAPRRLALRTQQSVMDVETSIEDYLRSTDKEELNPEGIKRDLQLLMQNPRMGAHYLGDRFSRMDRSTLIALLAQRGDMTDAEAEHVVTQIESVRDQMLGQIQQVQMRIQEVIDRIFNWIRDALNSLDRPELNYDGIRQDVRMLFSDPQAGFEALRTRLGQFDRGTLVAILSSRRDISEADANRIIDQIESARTTVLQRAERIQLEAQQRLEEVKHQAQRQMEETRKAAAAAAWWLFVTAFVSAITAMGGGVVGAL